MAAALEGIAPETAILDAAGVIVYVNTAWVEFGIENGSPDPEACIGRSYLDVCLGASSAGDALARKAAEGIEAVIAGALPCFGQKYPCHSREQERWFFMAVTRASIGSDIVIAHNDITQPMQAERGNAEAERRLILAHERFEASRALAESEERFRKIVDTAIDAIVVIDGDGRIQSLNHAAERIFGYNRGEAVGSNVSIFLAEPHQMFQEGPRRQSEPSKSRTEKTARRYLSNFVSLPGVRQGNVITPVSCVTSPGSKAAHSQGEGCFC